MDSITQIVLGAAVGEVVLGKKLGNRAMVWGAIGGTIPDLDIIANLFADDITALAAHRGISHSFFFAFVGSILFAYLTNKLFSSGLYQRLWYRKLILGLSVLFVGMFSTVIYLISTIATNSQNLLLGILMVGVFILISRSFYFSYLKRDQQIIDVGFKDWYWFFFWTICTHFLLDVFTSYGTQVFQPFSDYRVAFNTISVADPMYTIPFIICVIIASRMSKGSISRWKWNWAGILVSTLYLLLTVFNKINVDRKFQELFAKENIEYHRYTAGPSILNNALWSCTVEGDTAYYNMMYSIFDGPDYKPHVNVISKNHDLISDIEDTREIETLKWFTNNYFTISKNDDDGTFQLSDLRYGAMRDEIRSDDDFVFKFIINKNKPTLEVTESRSRNVEDDTLAQLWKRILGYRT